MNKKDSHSIFLSKINDADINQVKNSFLKKYKNEEIVQKLKLTDEEILNSYAQIKKAVDCENTCKKTKDYCPNDGIHYELIKKDDKIELKVISCIKNQKENTFNKIFDSYINKEITSVNYQSSINDFLKYKNDLNSIKELIVKKNNIYIFNEQNNISAAINAICNELALMDYTIGFFNTFDFSIYASAISFDRSNNILKFINTLKNVDILVFDEIGNEKFRYFIHMNIIYPILNHRLINKKATIFISQYELKDIKKQYELQAYKEKINIAHFIKKINNIINKKIYKF